MQQNIILIVLIIFIINTSYYYQFYKKLEYFFNEIASKLESIFPLHTLPMTIHHYTIY